MKRRNALYLRFLVPYFAMIALPLVVGVITYRQALSIMSAELERNSQDMVGWTADSIGQSVQDIVAMTRQIENDTLIRDFQRMENPYQGANTYQVVRTINHLFDYRITTDLLLNYYVYFPRSGLALGPRFACRIEEFPKAVLSLQGVSDGKLIETVTGSYPFGGFLPLTAATMDSNETTVLIYLRSFGYPSYTDAVIVVILDGDEIVSSLDRLRVSTDAWARITDRNGTVIAHVGPDPPGTIGSAGDTEPSNRILIASRTSAELGWTVEAGQPYSEVTAKVAGIRRSAVIVAGIVLLIGAFAALGLAFLNFRPINALFTMVRGISAPESSDGVFRYLERSIRTIVSDRTRLEEAVAVQNPFLRMALADQLLRGHVDPDQLQSLSHQAGVDWASLQAVAGIATLSSSDSVGSADEAKYNEVRREIRAVLASAVETSFDTGGFLTIVDSRSDALVLCLEDESPIDCRHHLTRFVHEINRHLFDQYGCGLSFSFGSFRSDPLQLPESFEEARKLAGHSDHGEDSFLFWEESESESGLYSFPERVETRLMNAVRAGNSTLALQILSSVLEENLGNRKLSDHMLTVFRFELIGTMTKLCEEMRIDDPELDEQIVQITSGAVVPLDRQTEIFTSALSLLCDRVNDRRRSRTAALVEQIRNTVDEQISSPDLGLVSVAEQHGLSGCTRIFKEHTGENFLQYIERSRTCTAMHLLESTTLSVKEIARRVGYRSSNTFCKAFRRITGCTASDFRTKHASSRNGVA